MWRRKWQPTPVFLSGEFHGQRSPVACGPWGHKESDTTERLTHTHIIYDRAMQHVGAWLPNQGWDPHPLHWKNSLNHKVLHWKDHQGSPVPT